MPLSTNSEKAREEATSAKTKLDALPAKADLAAKNHDVALAKVVKEERRDEVEGWKTTTLRSGAM